MQQLFRESLSIDDRGFSDSACSILRDIKVQEQKVKEFIRKR